MTPGKMEMGRKMKTLPATGCRLPHGPPPAGLRTMLVGAWMPWPWPARILLLAALVFHGKTKAAILIAGSYANGDHDVQKQTCVQETGEVFVVTFFTFCDFLFWWLGGPGIEGRPTAHESAILKPKR